MMEPWFRRLAGVLEREEAALEASGIAFERIEEAFARGIAQYNLSVQGPSGPVNLVATYPDAFPYFKPFVATADLRLSHHHHPVTGEVCLLDDAQAPWQPETDTLAALIREQWPRVLEANASGGRDGAGALIEAEQAEPITVYLPTQPGSHLVLTDDVNLAEALPAGEAFVTIVNEDPLRGFVHFGAPPAAAGSANTGAEPVQLPATWVRLGAPPAEFSAKGLYNAVLAEHPSLAEEGWTSAPGKNRSGKAAQYAPQVQLVLVAMPEEVAHREQGIGWTAMLRTRPAPRKRASHAHLVKVGQAGRDQLLIRAPELASLAAKKVLLVGGGGVGSTLAQELARTIPGQLTVIDGDTVELAQAVRFHSAFRFMGQTKVLALGMLIHETQPYTQVKMLEGHIGRARWMQDDVDQHAVIASEVEGCDLVIDATADTRVQHYLSDLAREACVTYMHVEGTVGAWAGLVGVYRSGSGPCWVCVQYYLADGTIGPLPASSHPGVQPPGCARPTYVGAGFDLATVAVHAVRLAAAELTDEHGYPNFTGQVHTVQLRTHDGGAVPAQWTVHDLGPHAGCPAHQ